MHYAIKVRIVRHNIDIVALIEALTPCAHALLAMRGIFYTLIAFIVK